MEEFTPEQWDRIKGRMVVKNVSGNILSLTSLGQYEFDVDEEINLLDNTLPDTIRAANYHTAQNMVGMASVNKKPQFTTYELAQRIAADELSIIEDKRPDPTILQEISRRS